MSCRGSLAASFLPRLGISTSSCTAALKALSRGPTQLTWEKSADGLSSLLSAGSRPDIMTFSTLRLGDSCEPGRANEKLGISMDERRHVAGYGHASMDFGF
eukprot:TRINITY_DN12256_c0_g1_i4.p6 TRINITY_DN12256_c0_g1~~TRINITY_DN12256_c0_g1_i4.p6  ORF type:complete len:101 (-),score=17.29 TRINITY_DN12256_c0_g1_i4:1225-1527(-)